MQRVWRRSIGAIAIFAVLFAQMAVAAYACPALISGAQTDAVSWLDQDDDPGNPALCQQHCQEGDQNINDGVGAVFHLAFAPAFTTPVYSGPSVPAVHALAAPLLDHAPPPPLTIRHCCFRI